MLRKWKLTKRHTGIIEIVEADRLVIVGPWLIFEKGPFDSDFTDEIAYYSEDYVRWEKLPLEEKPKNWGDDMGEEPLGASIETDLSDERDIPLPGLETYGVGKLEAEGKVPFDNDTLALMELYHLDDLRDEETNALLGFICTGIEGMKEPCGMRYPTIADRMLHPPETCSGCFVRMANG
jgi:hypothetical protein